MGRIFAGFLILALLPFLAAISLGIKITSPGPILFLQPRVGLNEKVFTMVKFRTMYHGAHDEHKQLVSEEVRLRGSFLINRVRDHRTNPVGRFLRRWSLDELPQLINIVRGEMRFVGPRPMMVSELEQLTSLQRQRFCVPPGLTGLAQINGRSSLSVEEYVNYDLRLVRDQSPLLRLKILLFTPFAVIDGRGAS